MLTETIEVNATESFMKSTSFLNFNLSPFFMTFLISLTHGGEGVQATSHSHQSKYSRLWIAYRSIKFGASRVCGGSEKGKSKWEKGTGTWLERVWRQLRGREETGKRERRKGSEYEGR